MKKLELIIAEIDGFETHIEEIKKIVPKVYLEKYESLSEEEGLQELVAGLLLRKFLGVEVSDDIFFEKEGRPFLKNDSRFFSLSHSKKLAVLGIFDANIGVDVEIISRYNPLIAKKYLKNFRCSKFSYEDKDRLNSLYTKEWTSLEAVLKYFGKGFSNDSFCQNINFDAFCVKSIKYGQYIISLAVDKDEKFILDKLIVKHFTDICYSL